VPRDILSPIFVFDTSAVLLFQVKAVGIRRLPVDKARRLEAVCAKVTLKICSFRLRPPQKKHMPKTMRRFESILPIIDVCTIRISLCTKAIIPTMSSTALLNFIRISAVMIFG